ncbi:hypothetical protein SAMN06265222_106338 [Neorhodopirellula lusitana]|uniref:Uncharacterized protein n=1 Tax=Neorhodopirellula lusitana TaxID=445327 RepID=A0ABY1Q5F9_9BACT|nr:hypothetical protein [Neorhodopirellula lusitana]SMP60252.1 hypothetical protein SAMN06265222_106338 [Neorhodopirellula lusitana]
MKYALVITGVLAGLAITAPQLVVLGYFLLIVPGLVLTVAPTVFVYLAVTAAVRRLLPISSPMAATAVAFVATLMLGWAVMQPFRMAAISAYRSDDLPDVLPNHAIELDGNVRVDRPNERSEPECDYLCLALLDSPRVQSLTTVTAGRGKTINIRPSVAYELVSAKNDFTPGIFPSKPGQIVREYPPLVQANRGTKLITASKAVEANWALRLAGQERLREVNAVESETGDWVIRVDIQTHARTSTLRRITILDSTGRVHFRKSYHKQAVPSRMLYFGFYASMSGSASFHVGRQVMESGERSMKPESALLQAIKFPIPPCEAEALERLRNQAEQALDSPAPTAVQLDLAKRCLGLFFFDTQPRDHALIARIVADQRIEDIETQIKNVFPKSKTPVEMLDPYIDRISMDHTSASLRHWLAERLANFPPGTFSNPSPTYLAIWNSPENYQHAAPLIATLADLGPDRALPKIDAMLDYAIELPHWRDRRSMMDGIREALVRLGPQASGAAPRIQKLFLHRPSPIMNNAGEADDWRFALARMGVALKDLPVFANQSPKSVERNLRKVAGKMRRYEQDNATEEEI